MRTSVYLAALLFLAACGGGTSPGHEDVNEPRVITDFPPLPNDNPPGASAKAITTATAIGRGVNFGNMLEAPTEGAWGLYVTDGFIDDAPAVGFQSVRLPVRWSNHAGVEYPFTIDPAFLGHVESIVNKLLAKGIVVVMNMHHYHQIDGDPPDAGEASARVSEVDLRFVMLWEQIAERFKNHNERLVFELYNEPHGRLNGEPWNVLAARTLGVVRKTNPNRIIVIGPTSWNSASELQNLQLPNDSNLIATIHNYAPFSFTHQGAEWVSPIPPVGVTCCSASQRSEMTAPLDLAKSWSVAKRYPVFVGEFGAYSKADEPSRIEFNTTMREAMESSGLSWTYWEYASGFGVFDPTAGTFRTQLLQSLLPP